MKIQVIDERESVPEETPITVVIGSRNNIIQIWCKGNKLVEFWEFPHGKTNVSVRLNHNGNGFIKNGEECNYEKFSNKTEDLKK